LQSVEVEILDPPIRLENGDLLLLCSDGLTVYLDDKEIFDVVTSYSPEKACEVLIDRANERGGRDNITVEIISIKNLGQSPEGETSGGEAEISHSGKILGDTQPVYPKRSESKPTENVGEIGWAALFYIVYVICMVFYFLHYFK